LVLRSATRQTSFDHASSKVTSSNQWFEFGESCFMDSGLVIIGQPKSDLVSLCELCPKPGECCRSIVPSYTVWMRGGWRGNALKMLAAKGLPFMPVAINQRFRDRSTGRYYCEVECSCPNLDEATGRCTDYANRPDICRNYVPASDDLCVLGHGEPNWAAETPK
jgi:Fe-S-cluster containining protein